MSEKSSPPSALSMSLSLYASIEEIIAKVGLRLLLVLFFLMLPLVGLARPLYFLDAIYANDHLLFHKQKETLECSPYGIWTLDKVLRRKDLGSVCKKALNDFFARNPRLRYLLYYKLHPMQRYKIELRGGACIIYVDSKQTLSEILLLNGVAIVQPRFIDEEFRYRFYQANQVAKFNKRGMWGDVKLKSCLSEFFKE